MYCQPNSLSESKAMMFLYKIVLFCSIVNSISAGQIQIVEQRFYVHDDTGLVTQLNGSSSAFTSTLDSNNIGTFGWSYTNTTGSTLNNVRVFGFLDADIDRSVNTFFNEYGEISSLALPPGALAGAIAPSSWQIDEPGFVFGTIIQDLQAGLLRNQNYVPFYAPDDVSLALGFEVGSLGPSESVIASFEISTQPIGGLRQTDPDATLAFYFNGYATVSSLPPVETPTPEPASVHLILPAIIAAAIALRFRN